jgi:hypothetical protein
MKTLVIIQPPVIHAVKKWILFAGFLLSYCMLWAQDPWHQPDLDSTAQAAVSEWESAVPNEETEEFGLFIFQFGNGMIATLDEPSARDIGVRVGVSSPIRGINKTGDYYAELLRANMLAAMANGGSMQPVLLKGFLAPNGKVYRSRAQYESQPHKPLVDPSVYGRYNIQQGGQWKVFTL